MLVKFETKSNRVKGLSFHPKRPWILASLHNGLIQLWDYRMGTLLDQFNEHEGPVRAVDFHRTQLLFVSGGDDYKIKVWNYKLRRCLFTLTGHLDYIRTVEFHLEQPWIVSASDDQTVRVWNWQSRQCLAILTGHNHYVMCASFHPTEDLVVSASLDQSIRVWDISGLKRKSAPGDDLNAKISQLNQDLFGSSDVMVKYMLEGHDRGVNWVCFHPTLQLIVSAADDRQVKLWRINDTKAWEVETLTGHFSNVSCVRFHPKKDLIISNSEDKTIRVWKLSTNQFVTSYRREQERFWILAVHPTQNLIAAGHDNGLVIFKLERERPVYSTIKDNLYYVRDKFLRKYNLTAGTDAPIALMRRTSTAPLYSLSFNLQENVLLLTSGSGEQANYELFKIPKNSSGEVEICTQIGKGKGISAVLTGLNKYAVLLHDKAKLQVKYLQKDSSKEVSLPISPVDAIFTAPSGRVLLKAEDKIHMYDLEQGQIVGEISAANVKYVVWSDDYSRVALMCKHVIIIANNKLEQMCSIHETIRIKSGSFDDSGVFLYTTLSHMKYCLPNGDSGTIKTLEVPLYIARVKGNTVHFIDREGVVSVTTIDSTEFRFKLALLNGQTREIKAIIGQSKILGDSIIAYLQQRGYPDIAMKFVEDDVTKFELALECGNIETAAAAAQKIDDKESWERLGSEALRRGNLKIVEKAYQQNKDLERLSFLYLITGNTSNLQKMVTIAQKRNDIMSRFNYALYLGDIEKRVKVLIEAGQQALAFAMATTHGLHELAEEIKKTLDPEIAEKVAQNIPQDASLLLPPAPLLFYKEEKHWPLLQTEDSNIIETSVGDGDQAAAVHDENVSSWGFDLPVDGSETAAVGITTVTATNGVVEEEQQKPDELSGDGWQLDLGVNIGDIPVANVASSLYIPPKPDDPICEYWKDNSNHAADHAAAGSFNTAMDILNKTCGIVNFVPLKDYFLSLYSGARSALPMPLLPPITIYLQRAYGKGEDNSTSLPLLNTFILDELCNTDLKLALKHMTTPNFDEAQKVFRKIMHALLFVVLNNKKEEREAKDLLRCCAEYVTACRLELARASLKDTNPQRSCELSAYFTRCKLNSAHIMLSLASAMTVNFKAENFLLAAEFAKRLSKLNCPPKMQQQATFVIQQAQSKATNKYTLNYDDKNPFVLCGIDIVPIYSGSTSTKCAYCGTSFLPKHQGKLCTVCEVAEVGLNVPGLQLFKQNE